MPSFFRRSLTLSVFVFFTFIFAFTLGTTLSDRQMRTLASEHCTKNGGVWNTSDYCEKIVSVCEPATL
jgi:hypothetical protein